MERQRVRKDNLAVNEYEHEKEHRSVPHKRPNERGCAPPRPPMDPAVRHKSEERQYDADDCILVSLGNLLRPTTYKIQ